MRYSLLIVVLGLVLMPGMSSGVSPIPQIANPGFEEFTEQNHAPGWGWYVHTAKASFRSETTNPHSGKRCLVFRNESGLAAEVYGRLFQHFGVLPGTKYELSAWVCGESVSRGIHFTDWNCYTLNVPEGTYDWRKISTEFVTGDGQTSLNLGINITNTCDALAVDDIAIRPVGMPLAGKGVSGSVLVPGQVFGDNKKAYLYVSLDSSWETDGTIRARVKGGRESLLDVSEKVTSGENMFNWEWDTARGTSRELEYSITVSAPSGKRDVVMKGTIQKISPSVLLKDIEAVEKRVRKLDVLLEKCAKRNIPVDYPQVAKTMLEQFIPLTKQDAVKGEERRANFAIKDFNRSLDEAISELRAYLKTPHRVPVARRYQTGAMDIDGLNFVGDRRDSAGKLSRGPVFFCGMGHFNQVRVDMPRWQGYGVNIIQVEVGPAITMPSENEIDLRAAQAIAKVLDEAAEQNVMVNVLLSPHYFPQWAMEKWQHLGSAGGGFLQYCIYAPEAKQVIENYLRVVVPLFKDKPALHSFCLSNEPMYNGAAECGDTLGAWVEFLSGVHGSVKALNEVYQTDYARFEEVPIGGDVASPQFYDYVVFNQQRFAGWHEWMADVIHEIAPEVPVHAKIMWCPISVRHSVLWGVDPELFGELSQINGNDCMIWQGGDPWAIGWSHQNMFYGLQRSVARKPIFNSENHLQPDGSVSYVPPEHYRTALWQGAVHGQGATTIWVWERTLERDHKDYAASVPFYGNVMDRPGCAQAVGTTCLDLNRFAEEVTALQNVRAPVALVYSMASFAKNDQYLDYLTRAYTALNFCGVKVDFITDKQLAAGKLADYRLVVLPNVTHMTRDAFESLLNASDTTRLISLGDVRMSDPYGNLYPVEDNNQIRSGTLCIPLDTVAEQLWHDMMAELLRASSLPRVRVVDAETGEPVWGVEWLPVQIGDRVIVNLVNLLNEPRQVKFTIRGQDVPARDRLSFGGLKEVRTLEPVTPVLAEMSLPRQ